MRKAVADGVLAEQALAPGVLNAAGLWRATEQLNQLGRRISAVHADPAKSVPNIAALLSETALWTRYLRAWKVYSLIFTRPVRSLVMSSWSAILPF